MGRVLVPFAMVAAAVAFAVAAAAAGGSSRWPRGWEAGVWLAILGGIVPMVFAVNVRIVPVFARRPWRSEGMLRAQIGCALLGAWLAFPAQWAGWPIPVAIGRTLALAGGLLFAVNLRRLLRQPAGGLPAPPLPFPEQAAVDRIATRFTRLAGGYLILGLALAAVLPLWRPDGGRPELAAAHAMLLGFFLSMAAGVCYHVLPRWTTRRWRWLRPIGWHFWLAAAGLPPMVIALAGGWAPLLAVAGPIQAAAVLLFLLSVAPLVTGLPKPTGAAFAAAAACLLVGVILGGWFAIDPALGARLRPVHAGLNLFGFAGLLISGAAVYLAPRFAGRPLRWPRLAILQVGLLEVGVLAISVGETWPQVGGVPLLAVLGHAAVAAAFLLLAAVLAGTFLARGRGTVSAAPLVPRAARPALLVR